MHPLRTLPASATSGTQARARPHPIWLSWTAQVYGRRCTASYAGIKRLDQRAIARVLPARPHLAGHVAEPDSGLGIAESERATGAEVAERPGAPADRPLCLAELEAEPEPRWAVQDQVVAVYLLRRRGVK